MALFEHVIILKQSLSSNELSNELKNHTDMVSELSGNVVYQESWGMRNLAYPIKNNKKAFYEFMNIEMPQENIDLMNSKLNLNEYGPSISRVVPDPNASLGNLEFTLAS